MDVEKRHTGRDRAFFYKKSGRLAFQISGDKVRGAVSHLGLLVQIQKRKGWTMQETKKETYETPQLEKQEPLPDITAINHARESGMTQIDPPSLQLK